MHCLTGITAIMVLLQGKGLLFTARCEGGLLCPAIRGLERAKEQQLCTRLDSDKCQSSHMYPSLSVPGTVMLCYIPPSSVVTVP